VTTTRNVTVGIDPEKKIGAANGVDEFGNPPYVSTRFRCIAGLRSDLLLTFDFERLLRSKVADSLRPIAGVQVFDLPALNPILFRYASPGLADASVAAFRHDDER
jgi:hypothetical protein